MFEQDYLFDITSSIPPTSGTYPQSWINNGECDEPVNCPVGTDTNDCAPTTPCHAFNGCCQDRSVTSCGFSCSDEQTCCRAISGCTWTAGTFGGTCLGRPTQNAVACCGGMCDSNDPATDLTASTSRAYAKTLLDLDFTLKNDCSFKYYYKFKGRYTQGYLWNTNVVTEIYEHWVQQTRTVDFKVEMQSRSGSESLDLPKVPIFGRGLTFAGVSVMAQVDLQISLGLTASLTYTGTDSMHARGRVKQMVKVGCRDQCRPGSTDSIFEKSFEAQNHHNFDAVDNVGGVHSPRRCLLYCPRGLWGLAKCLAVGASSYPQVSNCLCLYPCKQGRCPQSPIRTDSICI